MEKRRDFLRLLSISSLGIAASALPARASAAETDSGTANKANTMDAITAIRTRRSIRAFTDKPVSEEDLQLILQAAMQAPSAANQQPWDLVVIRNKETLARVGDINQYAAYAKNAPLAILVCLNLGKEKEATRGMGIIDVNLAAENILIAAHALGLGAVYTGIYPMKDRMKKFQELAGLPENILPIGLIIIGYPKIQPQAQDRFNKEAVHMEKWENK